MLVTINTSIGCYITTSMVCVMVLRVVVLQCGAEGPIIMFIHIGTVVRG
jgi:hypothetical protein